MVKERFKKVMSTILADNQQHFRHQEGQWHWNGNCRPIASLKISQVGSSENVGELRGSCQYPWLVTGAGAVARQEGQLAYF